MGEPHNEEVEYINNVLNSINVLEELTKIKSPETTVNYRSSLARLGGFKSFEESQVYSKKIVNPMTGESVINLGFALLTKRYDMFGPIYQYPKTFFIGPDELYISGAFVQLEENGSHSKKDTRPHIRNVDRIVYARYNGKDLHLVCVDIFNGIKTPNFIYYTFTAWVFNESARSSNIVMKLMTNTQSSDLILILKDVEHILTNFFVDGKYYTQKLIQNANNYLFIVAPDPHYLAIWIASDLSMNRSLPDPTKYPPKDTASINNRVLTSLVIGNIGYTIPSDPKQKNNPVPIGEITVYNLLSVFSNIVLQKDTDASEVVLLTNDINPYHDEDYSSINIDEHSEIPNELQMNENLSKFGSRNELIERIERIERNENTYVLSEDEL